MTSSDAGDCQHEGHENYTCSRCSDTYTTATSLGEHKYSAWAVIPTDVSRHQHECEICGKVEKAAHDWGNDGCNDCHYHLIIY